MSKRMRRSIFWSLALVLVGTLVLWDVERQPLEVEEERAFTVLNANAAEIEGGTLVSIVRSDFPELPQPVDPASELSVEQVEAIVRQATELGALEEVLRRAEKKAEGPLWVVIKVNIVELKERGSGVITDWRVVRAIVRIVDELAPGTRITIAEGGAWVPPEREEVIEKLPWADVGDGFEVAGFRQLLEDEELAGVRLDIIDLNFDEVVETKVPGKWHAQEKFFIPKTILENDLLIDVPVLKVTGTAGMTVAMKNFVGIAPGMVYGWAKTAGYPPGSGNPGIPHTMSILDETITDLASLSGVDFSVVDAIVGMEKAKTDEDGGKPVRMNAVVAGADVVAVDVVCARLMGMNPDDIEYIALGRAKGLGVGRLADIEVVGQRIDQVARRFEKYPAEWGSGGEYAHFGQGNRIWLLKGPIPQEGSAAPDPETLYPTPGKEGWSAPVYFHDAKIDLDRFFGDPVDCVAYAYAEFDAPATQKAELWLGSDEGLRVWINGKQVYRFEGRRRHRLPNERVPISIRKGRNTCLVEAAQKRGKYGFSMKVCELEEDPRYDGNTILGLHYYVPQKVGAATEEIAVVNEQERRVEWYEEHYVDVTQARRVKLGAFLPGETEAAWIGLDEPLMWGEKMELQAQLEGERLEIWTDNVRCLHLKREGLLAEMDDIPQIAIDGMAVRIGEIPANGIEVEASVNEGGQVQGWSPREKRDRSKGDEIVGFAPATLDREGLDSPLGNWFTDAIRWGTDADVAFQNNGGIRQDLEQGEVMVGDIFTMNFPDELYTFEVSGRELLEILEFDLRGGKERPMQVSGLSYAFDRSRPEGSRVVHSSVDPDRVYTVGAEDYLCDRGERFFGREVDFIETGVQIVDAQIRYARKFRKIVSSSEGRIEEIRMNFRHEVIDPEPPGAQHDITLIADVNGNGRNDIIIGAKLGDPNVFWYENPSWKRHPLATCPSLEAGGVVLDINGNGRPDFVAGREGKGKELYWFENPEDPTQLWKVHLITERFERYHDQVIGDIDGDGKPEILISSQNVGVIAYYDIPEDPAVSPWPEECCHVLVEDMPRTEGLVVVDLDGDGRNELIVGPNVFWPTGDPGDPWRRENFAPELVMTRAAVADIDGDGRLEIVLAEGESHPGKLVWCKPGDWELHVLNDNLFHPHSLEIADFNGDGRPDIFVAEMGLGRNPEPKMFIYANQGDGRFKEVVIERGVPTHEAKVGDLTGNGKPDIVGKPFMPESHIDVWFNE